MSKLKAILAFITGNIIKDLGKAFDKNFTSKEKNEKALIEKEKVYNEPLKIVAERTDPDVDSWLSKNVRPLCLLVALVTLSVIMIFDLQVDEGLRNTYAGWTGAMITFYFGYREVVKAIKRKKNS